MSLYGIFRSKFFLVILGAWGAWTQGRQAAWSQSALVLGEPY